jgi:TolA-binding protein
MITLALVMSCSETKTEEEYFTLANEQYGQEAYADAIESFKIIIEKYPDGETTAKATFMLGFINANSLENLDEAKKYYTLFVEKYPDHDLADDAKYELNTLGKDINDLPIFKDMQTVEQASTEK